MTSSSNDAFVLAGDIGGTKTNMGLFIRGKRGPSLKVFETYSSREAQNLESILERFLDRHRVLIEGACFGIAGPVVNGRCKTTNLPWEVYEGRIGRYFKGGDVRVINDLVGTAYAIPLLKGRDLLSLNGVKTKKGQNIALIAPGTGLGEALVLVQKGVYYPLASEGGHVDFAPRSEDEVGLWRYLKKRYGHVSIERVLSGPGFIDIYSCLKDSGSYREPAWLTEKLRQMDPAKAITEGALERNEALCTATLDMFVTILGAAAGNLALTGMATGGVYLGGGIPPRILPKLREGKFMDAFVDKGRFRDLLGRIPVRVILNDRAALLGAAHCAFEAIARKNTERRA